MRLREIKQNKVPGLPGYKLAKAWWQSFSNLLHAPAKCKVWEGSYHYLSGFRPLAFAELFSEWNYRVTDLIWYLLPMALPRVGPMSPAISHVWAYLGDYSLMTKFIPCLKLFINLLSAQDISIVQPEKQLRGHTGSQGTVKGLGCRYVYPQCCLLPAPWMTSNKIS